MFAERFNEYLVNSIRDIRNSIEMVHYENNVRISSYRFNFRAISAMELDYRTTGECQLAFY